MIARTRIPAAMPSVVELAERARWLIDCFDVETSTPLIDGRPSYKVELIYGETVLAQLVAERLPRTMRLGMKAIPEGSCVYDLDWDIVCERDVLVQSERREVQPRLFVEMSVDMEDGCFRRAFEAMQARIVKAEGAEAAASAFLCAQICDRPRRSQIPLYRGVGFACHRQPIKLPSTCRAYDLTRSLLLPKPAPIPDPAPTLAPTPTPSPEVKIEAEPVAAPAPAPASASAPKPTSAQRSKLAQQAEQKRLVELRRARRAREEEEEEEEWVPSTRRKRGAAASSTQPKRYKTRQQS